MRAVRLREQVRRWAVDGVDIVQLREKQLESGELFALTVTVLDDLRRIAQEAKDSPRTRLLVNSRPDIAAAAGADGVHITAHHGALTPAQARQVFAGAARSRCLVSVSCHTMEEVALACKAGADIILFGPVFEKRVAGKLVTAGLGLAQLREAAGLAGTVPVLALGGVTEADAAACIASGAAGVAGIRLFAG